MDVYIGNWGPGEPSELYINLGTRPSNGAGKGFKAILRASGVSDVRPWMEPMKALTVRSRAHVVHASTVPQQACYPVSGMPFRTASQLVVYFCAHSLVLHGASRSLQCVPLAVLRRKALSCKTPGLSHQHDVLSLCITVVIGALL